MWAAPRNREQERDYEGEAHEDRLEIAFHEEFLAFWMGDAGVEKIHSLIIGIVAPSVYQ
jgi:hypothetical protein